MKVALDLNVVLDVVQNRQPRYQDLADVLSRARTGDIAALVPSHTITTLYYVLAKAAGKTKADQTVDWLLTHFDIGVADKAILPVRQPSAGTFREWFPIRAFGSMGVVVHGRHFAGPHDFRFAVINRMGA